MTSEAECRRIITDRSGGMCEVRRPGVCLGRASNAAHRIPRSQGGAWDPSNVIHACGSGVIGCHGWETGHPREAQALGLRLWRYQVSLDEPVELYVGRVRLDDLGRYLPATEGIGT